MEEESLKWKNNQTTPAYLPLTASTISPVELVPQNVCSGLSGFLFLLLNLEVLMGKTWLIMEIRVTAASCAFTSVFWSCGYINSAALTEWRLLHSLLPFNLTSLNRSCLVWEEGCVLGVFAVCFELCYLMLLLVKTSCHPWTFWTFEGLYCPFLSIYQD